MKVSELKEKDEKRSEEYTNMFSGLNTEQKSYLKQLNLFFDLKNDVVKVSSAAQNAKGEPLLEYTIKKDGNV